MKTAKLSVLPIKDLNPAEYNPRKKLKPGDKEYEKIKHSIEEFGFADPVVVNSDMTIIGGHQRVTVAAALGYTEVPCAIVEVSKTQEKALNIALNKISGEWNQELLADLIQDLQDSDFDVGFTGFEPPEIEQLFSKVHDKKVKEDDFDVEAELKKPTVAQTGDVWLLGKHRVICGDSILPETYNILMDTFLLRTLRTCYQLIQASTLPAFCLKWTKRGMTVGGRCLIQKTSESPKTGNVCSLSQILEAEVDEKYYLSAEKTQQLLTNL